MLYSVQDLFERLQHLTGNYRIPESIRACCYHSGAQVAQPGGKPRSSCAGFIRFRPDIFLDVDAA